VVIETYNGIGTFDQDWPPGLLGFNHERNSVNNHRSQAWAVFFESPDLIFNIIAAQEIAISF
jgi:hypothetical protein